MSGSFSKGDLFGDNAEIEFLAQNNYIKDLVDPFPMCMEE